MDSHLDRHTSTVRGLNATNAVVIDTIDLDIPVTTHRNLRRYSGDRPVFVVALSDQHQQLQAHPVQPTPQQQ